MDPLDSLDKSVQKMYTKLGQKIPDKALYPIAFASWGIGMFTVTPATKATYLLVEPMFDVLYPAYFFINLPDMVLNMAGMSSKKKKEHSDAIAKDRVEHYFETWNRNVRLPLFVFGIGLVGKTLYDVVNTVVHRQEFPTDSLSYAQIGIGLLFNASSMYLKDQDPKLLKKSPSKIKAFFQKAYLALTAPKLVPVPVRVRRYEALEACIADTAPKPL